jgi:hypothetical protein
MVITAVARATASWWRSPKVLAAAYTAIIGTMNSFCSGADELGDLVRWETIAR